MKKTTLLKTLLVAVCLLTGTSTWGTVLYSWEGGSEGATQTGGTAAVTGSSDALNVAQSTVAGTLYVMQVASKQANVATSNITITLDDALQIGDIVRISGFQNKNASDKVVALYLGFKNGDTDKGNITETSSDNWVNLYSGYNTADAPETRVYSVTSALAGSNKIVLTRSQSGTNLWISKVEVIRPVVNADIDFSNAITDGSVAGTVNSMALSNTSGSHPFEKGYNGENTGILRVGEGTGTVTIPDLQLAGARDEVILTFDYYFGHLSGKYAGFYLYDESSNVIGSFYYQAYSGAADSNTFGFSLGDTYMPHAKSSGYTDNANIINASYKITFELHLNYSTGKMYARQYANGTLKQTTAEVSMGSVNPLKQFTIKSSYQTDTRRCWFDNLCITTIVGDYSTAKTITYAYEDNNSADITDLVLANGGVSSAVGDLGETFTPTYPASFTDAEYAYDYTYTSGGEPFTVTDDATITLVYTKTAHPTTDVTVQYKNGSSVLKSDVVHASYPVGKATGYALGDCVLDTTNKELYQTSASMGTWRSPAAAATIEEAVTTANIKNVVFFSEGEEIAGKYATGSSTIASRQTMGRFNEDTKICELEAGSYRFFAEMHCGNGTSGNVHATMYVKAGTENIGSKDIMARTNNQTLQFDFTLTGTTDIKVNYAGGSNSGIDYIYIQKTGESVTIGTSGFATFSSDYALNFDESDVTPYCASAAADGTVTMTKLTGDIAANTGLFLKGDNGADTYSIPVASTAGSSPATNYLKPTTGSNIYDGEKCQYVYAYQNSTYGFFKVASSGLAPAKGKAYLETAASAAGARMTITFDDEVTGIENLTPALSEGKGTFYDLQGRRVAQPTKGLYIVNGRKVVVK